MKTTFLFLFFCFAAFTTASAQYISSTCVQVGNPIVFPNQTNQQLLRIEIEIGPNSVTLTNMAFNTNGSTNPVTDISLCKLFFYNDSSLFNISTATLMGTYQNPWFTDFTFLTAPNPSYSGMSSFTGMLSGKNYFWLLYDVSPGAIVCDMVDAEFIYSKINTIDYIPTVQAPPGFSTIGFCPNAVSENSTDPSFRIFPNPSDDQIRIEFDSEIKDVITLDLLDITGRKISTLYEGTLENQNSGLNFSVSNYKSGIYMVRTTGYGKESLKKLVIL